MCKQDRKIEIKAELFYDQIVFTQEIMNGHIKKEIINFKEQFVIDGLKKLGWRSPDEKYKSLSNIDNLFIDNKNYTEIQKNNRAYNYLIEEIESIYEECNQDNWDGYNGLSIKLKVKKAAIEICDLLKNKIVPFKFQKIEVSPGADGSINFEYRKHDFSVSTFSITESKKIIFIVVDLSTNSEVNGLIDISEFSNRFDYYKYIIFN